MEHGCVCHGVSIGPAQLPHGSPAVAPAAVPGNHRDVASLLS
jgi:hypothetical protein